MNKNIYRDFAQSYDTYLKENHWTSPDIVFNLCKEYIDEGQVLLDIGIGTGLNAEPSRKAGLTICGLDNTEQEHNFVTFKYSVSYIEKLLVN